MAVTESRNRAATVRERHGSTVPDVIDHISEAKSGMPSPSGRRSDRRMRGIRLI
jgi:hypothetical protein